MSIRHLAACLLGAVLLLDPSSGAFAETELQPRCKDQNPLRSPFFGDLHVHTQFSLDASTQGTRNRPADAYRFARGEELGLQPYDEQDRPLRTARLARPLDFAAVTDHAELIGEWNTCNTPGLPGHNSIVCRVYRRWPRVAFFWMNFQAARAVRHGFCGADGVHCREAARAPWEEIRVAADEATDRSSDCSFTAFQAYEWTGAAGAGNNFHRNVIFKNSTVPELPIHFIDEPDLYKFWKLLREECKENGSGCDAVVIPHNSNLSGGLMFQTIHEDGTPISFEEAKARTEFEVLVEIMQHKGDSECHIGLGSTDELCGFEKLAMSNFSGRYSGRLFGDIEAPKANQFLRNTFKEGLRLESTLGVNPFKFGIIASTDTHLGTPGLASEDNYPGHGGAGNPAADSLPVGLPDAIDFNPGGLAVLWAEENTRESLFRAMRRREAYGTSGPRMTIRFFGGWDLPPSICEDGGFAAAGYATGVPMGGDLGTPPRDATAAPVFAISALADPGAADSPSTPLQRVQIIKGWTDDGELKEQVFEVAGDPRNGASVDLATCETSGSGFTSLCGTWTDPEFDPTQHAFYYARVIENPTCRWSQRTCLAANVRCEDPSTVTEGFEACCTQEHEPSIQERGWTSPIWYSPAAP